MIPLDEEAVRRAITDHLEKWTIRVDSQYLTYFVRDKLRRHRQARPGRTALAPGLIRSWAREHAQSVRRTDAYRHGGGGGESED